MNSINSTIGNPLSILVSTHHLLDYTGSEVYTLFLCKKLKEKGHMPVVYSKYIDKMEKEFIDIGIPITNNLNDIKKVNFDIAHVHHSINAIEVRSCFPHLPIIYVCHGVIPFLEHPPLIDINISKYIAVSEEVHDYLIQNKINSSKVQIIRNVIDQSQFIDTSSPNNSPKSILVISARIDNKRLSNIRKAAKILNIDLEMVGGKFGQVSPKEISKHIQCADIVFSLGRGAVEAIFSGKVPFIYDYLGGDGLITSEIFDESKKCNFSGRRFRREFSVNELVNELRKYNPHDIPILKSKAIKEFSSEINTNLFIDLYNSFKSSSINCSNRQVDLVNYISSSINVTRGYTEQLLLRKPTSNNSFSDVNTNSTDMFSHNKALFDYDVSIIIALYNKCDLTKQCLDSIYRLTSNIKFEIILVDNGSTDGTVDLINNYAKNHDNLKIVINGKNLGFSAANNIGADISRSKYLLLLNNDTIVTKGWLKPLMAVLDRDQSAAAVGPMLLFPDGTIQHAGIVMVEDNHYGDPLSAKHIYYKSKSNLSKANIQMEYQAITGACFLVRREVYLDAGKLDEFYWNGYEDIDLCFKLRTMGYKIVYQPHSEVYHLESQSGPERFIRVSDNIKLLHKKWIGVIKPDIIINKDGNSIKNSSSIISPYSPPHSVQKSAKIVDNRKTVKGLTSIVILTFNQLEYTKKCIDSLSKYTPESHEIIFVDNASTDGTNKWLKTQCKLDPNYKLINNATNKGFAEGCNQGIEAASGEYILLLNNDVVVTKNWLGGMLDCLKADPLSGIIGPMTNNISGPQRIPQVGYESIDDLPAFAEAFSRNHQHRRIRHQRIVGFCMLFHRKIVERIGLLDSSFGTGNFEDDDFCLRSALHGFHNYIAADIFIHHFGSKSFIGNRIDYKGVLSKNKTIFLDKWNDINRDDPLFKELFLLNIAQRADELIHMGSYDKAEKLLLDGIRRFPDRHELVYRLAEFLCQENQYENALKLLDALPDEKILIEARVIKGFCHEGLDQLQEANNIADQLCCHERVEATGWNLKGIIAYKQGDFGKSESYFNKALDISQGYDEPHANLGILYWESDKNKQALSLFAQSFMLSPASPVNAANYHAAAIACGAIKQAQKAFLEAAALFPLNKQIACLHIDLLIRQGQHHAAIDAIENAILLFGSEDGMLKAGLELRRQIGTARLKPRRTTNCTVSLCLIVKNAETSLARCLKEFELIVDEIIVIDTGSTDSTREIAELFGAKVFDFNPSDKMTAPQLASSRSLCDWNLFLYGDEKIASVDLERLVRLFPKERDGSAFDFKIRNYVNTSDAIDFRPNRGDYPDEERGVGWIENEQVRLLPRDKYPCLTDQHKVISEAMPNKLTVSMKKTDIVIHNYGGLPAMSFDVLESDQQLNDRVFPPLIFVVGIPRSGTTWLLSILENHPSCKALTPELLDIQISHPTKETGLFARGLPDHQIIKKLSKLPKNIVYVEKTPSHLFELQRIKALIPHAKIILVKRDPMDVLFSMTRKNPFWKKGAPRSLKDALRLFRKFSKAQYSWSDYDFTVKYEDLWANTSDEVNHLFRFLGFSTSHTKQIIETTQYGRNLNGNLKSVFRKGVPGQGETEFSNDEKELIRKSFSPLAKNALNLFDQACRFYEQENYEASLDALQRTIHTHSDSWKVYDLFVNLMLQSGQEATLVKQLRPLETRSDLPANMLALIGSGYEASGQLPKAADYADRSLSGDPDCARAWNLKGVLAFRKGEHEAAEAHFKTATGKDTTWGEPWTNLGTVLWEQGESDKALDCFVKGFRQTPTAPNVATTYHLAVIETGSFEQARTVFEEIVSRHPDFKKAHFLLIDILLRLEAHQAAMEQIENVLVRFGIDPQLLESAKVVRSKMGPMVVEKSMHPSLSLCMILKNEEKYLPRCLENLKPIVDEIIVVDTGSEDATRDIAKVFGAKVFEYEWNDDFAAARNRSLEKANGDWILVMDADECIASSDYDSILTLIRKYKNEKTAFLLTTRNYISGYNGVGWVGNDGAYGDIEAGCGWVPSTKTRLFKNCQRVRFEYPVHELVEPSLDRNGFRTVSCDVPVHHYGCLESEQITDKGNLYDRISKRKLKELQHDPKVLKELAVRANMLGDYDEAIDLWSRLVIIQPNNTNAFINLSATFEKLGRYMEAKAAAQNAIKIAPGIKEGYLNLGRSEFFLGNYLIGCEIFKKAIRIEPKYYPAIFLLGVSEICSGDREKGMSTISQLRSLGIWTSLTYAIQELAETLLQAGFKKQSQDLTHCASGLNLVECSESYDIVLSGADKSDDSLVNLSMAS